MASTVVYIGSLPQVICNTSTYLFIINEISDIFGKKKKKKAHYGLMIWLKLMGEAQDGKLGVVGNGSDHQESC